MSTPGLRDRLRGMIWGQFVGDAATLGTHWIYNLEELALRYPAGIHGFEAPQAGHYHFGKQPGDQTHYGDAALLLLESMAEHWRLELADFARRFVAFFGDPACRSYRDHATKDTLANLSAGPGELRSGSKTDDQPATVSRLAPVVARHGDAREQIEALTRFCQNNDAAVAYAVAQGHLLAGLLGGGDFRRLLGAIGEAQPAAKVRAAFAAEGKTVEEATLAFGQGCPLPKSFPAAIHAALAYPDDFRAAILATTRAGGDSAGRASMIGAWLGAAHGIAGVPAEWRERLTARTRIAEGIERLLARLD